MRRRDMRTQLEMALKKYPSLRTTYDEKHLKRYVEEATKLGMQGVTNHLATLEKEDTLGLVTFLALEQAIRNDDFTQAAELSAAFFTALCKAEQWEAARTFAVELCS